MTSASKNETKMKKQIIGTLCACMGLLFASGATIVNGLLAIACFSIAALCLSEKAQTIVKSQIKIIFKQTRSYRKAA